MCRGPMRLSVSLTTLNPARCTRTMATIKKDDIPSVPAYHALIPVILSYHGSDVLLTMQKFRVWEAPCSFSSYFASYRTNAPNSECNYASCR
ncbi:hypothetical protein B0J13DRAFT_568855, partial [Dactylonectria estremocensis]